MGFHALASRRLLLGRIGASIGVFGTFLTSAKARRPPPHRPESKTVPLVMLDPGHGGKDPGAIGVSGTYEKHVALAAALTLKQMLENDRRYRVALTRESDRFIPLEQRVEIAQRHGASLFVSMHADALPDHEVRGASVYTLAKRASDPEAQALAIRENSADRYLGYKQFAPVVAEILVSLVQRETRVGSIRMAHDVVQALQEQVPMLPNPDRHAGFVVLTAADIPSVLVEMGFMSNRQDESFLRQPAHRERVALAMKQAVDTWFAAMHTRDLQG